MKLTRFDIAACVTTGITAGFSGWRLLTYFRVPEPDRLIGLLAGISWAWLMIMVPLVWLAGVKLGYALSRRWPASAQFGKYAAIGFTNAAVDFGIFNFLFVLLSRSHTGFIVSAGASFCVAAVHSYLWNKYWAFAGGSRVAPRTATREIVSFVVVILFALAVNTVTAYLVFVTGTALGGSAALWANLGKTAGSAVALLFSFLGFRLVVFASP